MYVMLSKYDMSIGRLPKSSDKKESQETTAAHKQADLIAEEDTFRGVHLDPNAHHWDEVSFYDTVVINH